MKFKSILPALIVAFSTTFMVVSCANDDTDNMTDPGQQDVSFSELPVNARNLIQDKYNETDIDEILRLEEGGYNVSVKNIRIEFDKDGNWKKIKSKDNTALPDHILTLAPASITSYIKDYHPDYGILQIEKKDEKYEVRLTGESGAMPEFDLSGNIIKDDKMTFPLLPEKIQTFIQAHFDVKSIREINKNDKQYQVTFRDETRVIFDLAGNWNEVSVAGDASVPVSVIALLPDHIVSYIFKYHPYDKIHRIQDYEDAFVILLGDNIELSLDKENSNTGDDEDEDNNGDDNGDDEEDNNNGEDDNSGNIEYPSLPKAAQEFLTKHYANIAPSYIKRQGNQYRVRLVDGTEFEFLASGEVQLIVAPYMGSISPDALMPAIGNYIKTRYPNKIVFKYVKQGYQGYMVQFSGYPVVKAFFDINGNFIKQF